MTRPRYIAWILPGAVTELRELSTRLTTLARITLGPDMATFSAGRLLVAYACPRLQGRGGRGSFLILGRLYGVTGEPPLETLSAERASQIMSSQGARLASAYWGPYVAFLADTPSGPVTVIRDPTGGLPCYFHAAACGTVIASDLEIARLCGGLDVEIDWREIAIHLQTTQLRRRRTAIVSLDELLWGERLTDKAGTTAVDQLWTPWTFAASHRQIEDRETAVALLRETVVRSVRSVCAPYSHILLTVSGGLDSSILAASLATIGASFSCLTMATEEPAGDERHFARLIAKATGSPLYEAFEAIGAVDMTTCHGAHLPRPISRAFAQSIDNACAQIAEASGADVYFGGAGGDNVFCFLLSAAPAADLLRKGRLPHAWATSRDLALLGEVSLIAVLAKAMRRAWFRRPGYRWSRDVTFLSDQVKTRPVEPLEHPWLTAPNGALPGKSGHIASIMNIQNHLEGFARELERPVVAPLLAQPIVELCLRIPASMWCAGGHDRSVAREAFADRLPTEIMARREKGSPDGFVARLFAEHRVRIAEMLADGKLARHGLLDQDALAMALSSSSPTIGTAFLRVMKIVDVEMWARTVATGLGTSDIGC
ncbi:lasso peptide isopeptide bond-forming cyclase [soil metagenome]